MKLNKILWATDGSKESDDALNYATIFAKAFDAEIIGLHVLKTFTKKIRDIIGKRLDIDSLMKEESSIWSKKLEAVKQKLKKEKLKFSAALVEPGIPHEKIIEVADQKKVDLIIMGKRGLSLKDRNLIGSNTVKVLQGSRAPVLAVKRGTKKPLSKIRKILVPVDITEKFNSILRYAVSLGNGLDANIKVIYVEELVSFPYEFPVSILNEMRNIYSQELKNEIEQISSREEIKINIEHLVVESTTPFLGIIRFAEREKPDLILMNTHGRKGLKKLLLGSVSEKLIHEAPCSILALRP